MATATTNVGLSIPEATDFGSRQRYNGNMEIIDTEFGKRKEVKRGAVTITIPSATAEQTGLLLHTTQATSNNIIILCTRAYLSGGFNDYKLLRVTTNSYKQPSGAVTLVIDVEKVSTSAATSSLGVTIYYYYIDE